LLCSTTDSSFQMKIAPNFGAILFKRIADYLHSLRRRFLFCG
jgi:hypothetical protein